MFYGFRSAGVIRDSAAAAAITWKNFSGSTFKPGDMKVLDLDGDGAITLNDRTIIGDPTPDFTYGMTNTFSFGGYELTGLLQGQHGGKVLNVNRIRTESSPRDNISSALDRPVDAFQSGREISAHRRKSEPGRDEQLHRQSSGERVIPAAPHAYAVTRPARIVLEVRV